MVKKIKKVSVRSLNLLVRSARASGLVHSIFPSTCNILFKGLGFVSIQGEDSFFSPLSLLTEGHLPDLSHIPIETPVHFDSHNKLLQISRETFDLTEAVPCSCFYCYPSRPVCCTEAVRGIMERVYAENVTNSENEIFSLMYKKCRLNLNMLQNAALHGDRPGMLAAAKGLIGMGRGLTPSGDDMLTGFCALAKLSPRLRKLLDSIAPEIIGHAAMATTPVSFEFIRCSFENEYSEITAQVLDAVSDCNAEACFLSCRELLKLGSSSGRDCLCGMISASQLLQTWFLGGRRYV